MASRSHNRAVTFEVLDGYLVRTVTKREGGTYVHRCPYPAFEAVAYAVDAAPAQGRGFTLETLAADLRIPFTQANVALEFLKERNVVVTRGRRNYPASRTAFEDAMVEYHALREKGGAV